MHQLVGQAVCMKSQKIAEEGVDAMRVNLSWQAMQSLQIKGHCQLKQKEIEHLKKSRNRYYGCC